MRHFVDIFHFSYWRGLKWIQSRAVKIFKNSRPPLLPFYFCIFSSCCIIFFSPSGAKDNYLPVPNSAATSLVTEMNFFRNKSHIVKATLEAQATLAKEHANFFGLKLEIKHEKAITDNLMRQIETLNIAKANLQSDSTTLGEVHFLGCIVVTERSRVRSSLPM